MLLLPPKSLNECETWSAATKPCASELQVNNCTSCELKNYGSATDLSIIKQVLRAAARRSAETRPCASSLRLKKLHSFFYLENHHNFDKNVRLDRGVLCLDYTSTTTCAVLTAQILCVCLCVRREGIGKLVQIVQSTSEL